MVQWGSADGGHTRDGTLYPYKGRTRLGAAAVNNRFAVLTVAGWRTLTRPRVDGKRGAVAQLGARLTGSQKVRGSSPLSSTNLADGR